MADKLNLEIITPERRVLSEKVDEIVVPGLEGELGILPQHTPLISQLQTGILSYRQGTEKKMVHVSGGFVEVLPDQVAVLSDVAERPEEIDLERARKARERAETRIATGGDDVDFRRAELKLQRAMIRIQLASKGL
ncbi:MAG: F0F1 ATP synthase subunit epsilon [Blastocatellia bacterium]|jgi:F-type H+-transporting ATPase subunit epsilon